MLRAAAEASVGGEMSTVRKCSRCGGNIVLPAYPGDGDYPVEPMCKCEPREVTYDR